MPRRTREETRELMLEVGADLAEGYVRDASEKALTALVADVRVADVVAAAGTTVGALYHIWPNQTEYQLDLLLYILAERASIWPRGEGAGQTQAISNQRDDIDEYVLGAELSSTVWHNLRSSDGYLLFVGAFALARHPEVRSRLKAAYDRSEEEFLPIYEWVLDQYDRRMRPGLTVRDMAVVFNALLEGFTLRSRVDPGATREDVTMTADDGGELHVSLFSLAADAVVRRMTEPRT